MKPHYKLPLKIDMIVAHDRPMIRQALGTIAHPDAPCPLWGDYTVPSRRGSHPYISFGCMALHDRHCHVKNEDIGDSDSCPVRARAEKLVQLSYAKR